MFYSSAPQVGLKCGFSQLPDQPGPIQVQTIASAAWVDGLSGLLNLNDPKVIQAGPMDHEEPIQIYTHLLQHPTQGLFMIDPRISKRFVEDPRSRMGREKLRED